ncbi:putative tRNA-m1A22 methylase [Lachnospiraceae bacterium KM106-2]|nr:putative tRNA-m1A22 methylase [Lachnospiraceae bacterium KM106-2]
MQLSDRLQRVANHVTPGGRVADIGCDHAYTSIYMIKNKIATSVIAMDINKGPLEKAKSNIMSAGLCDVITTRLSNGAKELNVGEVDRIVISGMGGILMKTILSDRPDVVADVKELVLQPQSEIAMLREYLHSIGYQIVQEDMLIDEGKYYTIIKAIHGTESYEKEIFYLYGKQLLESRHPILKKFLEKELNKKDVIMERLKAQNSEHARKRLAEVVVERAKIKEGLEYYDL